MGTLSRLCTGRRAAGGWAVASREALLGIVYSGDWTAFIKEALNMRTTIGVYCNLYAFIEAQDTV